MSQTKDSQSQSDSDSDSHSHAVDSSHHFNQVNQLKSLAHTEHLEQSSQLPVKSQNLKKILIADPIDLSITNTLDSISSTPVEDDQDLLIDDSLADTQDWGLWTESHLEHLNTYELDFQEFKCSQWVVKRTGELQANFIFSLSKQVSAFSNGSGGMIFIGIDDHGTIDGGVPIRLKPSGTREWLEDLLNSSVTPVLTQFNVFEVQANQYKTHSLIKPNHAVYVIDINSSLHAPHQAKDRRYYLRIAGKSRPMHHRSIEDTLRKNILPRVTLAKLHPYGEVDYDMQDSRGPRAFIMLRAVIHNTGRSMAKHVGIELSLPRVFTGREVRKRMEDLAESHYTQKPSLATFFHYHTSPLFPSQEVYVMCLWVCLHKNNLNHIRSHAKILWSVYADDAQVNKGSISLNEFPPIRQALESLQHMDL
jgi:hypothetical protein